MNAFQQAREVERVAREELLPWLKLSFDQVDETDHSELLQKICGDFILQGKLQAYGAELKAESEYTGNVFLETWSNLAWFRQGWMYTSQAHWLLYYFVKTGVLYHFDFAALKDWAFGNSGSKGQIYRYHETWQKKYDQANDTWGRLVPIEVLEKAGVLIGMYTAEDRRSTLMAEDTSARSHVRAT